MKKLTLLLTPFFFFIMLVSCKSIKVGSVVFTELITSQNLTAVELYNPTEKEIDLETIKLNIYSNGNTDIDYTVDLTGNLPSKGFYVVALEQAEIDETIKSKIDLFSDNLRFNGNDTLTLTYKKEIIATFGIIGSNINYGENSNMVKKEEFLAKSDYHEFDYIRYNNDITFFKTGTHNFTTEEVTRGPVLTSEDYAKPFISADNPSKGGGGVITVSLRSCVDGDTAAFNYPSDLGFTQGEKVRFMNIDTKETMSGMTQEWGVPAKNYTCDRLKSAKKIEIKSEAHFPLREGYGRLWGWIFVDGKLLNQEIAEKGYTDVGISSETKSSYKNINYNSFLLDSYNYAKKNQLGLFGEKDPYWDYETNQPK